MQTRTNTRTCAPTLTCTRTHTHFTLSLLWKVLERDLHFDENFFTDIEASNRRQHPSPTPRVRVLACADAHFSAPGAAVLCAGAAPALWGWPRAPLGHTWAAPALWGWPRAPLGHTWAGLEFPLLTLAADPRC